jgi:hypothetical protein
MKSAKTLDRRAGDKWKIAGVPQPVIDSFRQRTDEIEKEVRRLGMVDARQKVELGVKIRFRKQKELTPEHLRKVWDKQLTDVELEAEEPEEE